MKSTLDNRYACDPRKVLVTRKNGQASFKGDGRNPNVVDRDHLSASFQIVVNAGVQHWCAPGAVENLQVGQRFRASWEGGNRVAGFQDAKVKLRQS